MIAFKFHVSNMQGAWHKYLWYFAMIIKSKTNSSDLGRQALSLKEMHESKEWNQQLGKNPMASI